jgi:hypothetical protein
MGVEQCTNYGYTLCLTTINLLIKNVFYNIYTNLIYDLISEKMMSQTITDEFIYISV